MKFTWLGGAAFLLELGPFRVVGDPVSRDRFQLDGNDVERLAAHPNVELGGSDVLLVTSPRPDHCDPDAITEIGAARVLAPRAAGLPQASPLEAGESQTIEQGGMKLEITAVPAGNEGTDLGYFMRLRSGERPFTVYVTGDTLFSETTRELQRTRGYANLLVLNIGAERSADGKLRSPDAKEAMQLVYRMQPNAIAAVHHDTFSHYTETIDPFIERIGLTIYEKRLRVLRGGESFEKTIAPGE
jgi:L-ascorbate metabolism protein UlaG (beta-lactamase superfamily)